MLDKIMDIYMPGHGSVQRLDFCRDYNIGLLYSSHRCEMPKPYDRKYIIDNGAYSAYLKNKVLDVTLFYAMLSKLRNYTYKPTFVCIPDIVAGGVKSFKFSLDHIGKIPKEFRKYFVVQDGQYDYLLEETVLPLIDGIFVGGTTKWKWRSAHNWIDWAHENNIKCHIGRVGTWKNFLKAYNLGADSIDGSTPMRHDKLGEILTWRQEIQSVKQISEDELV